MLSIADMRRGPSALARTGNPLRIWWWRTNEQADKSQPCARGPTPKLGKCNVELGSGRY